MSGSRTEAQIDYHRALAEVARYFDRQRERARPRSPAIDVAASRRPSPPDDLRYPIPALDPKNR